jgi:hypothetical protein
VFPSRTTCVFTAVWLITANYNETRAPAQRQRSWYGTGAIPVLIISSVIRLAVPRADWRSVTFSAPWARFLGLAILLAATTLEFKIRIEERFMTAEFPEKYPRYRGWHPLARIQGGEEGGGRAGQDRRIRDESRHA